MAKFDVYVYVSLFLAILRKTNSMLLAFSNTTEPAPKSFSWSFLGGVK